MKLAYRAASLANRLLMTTVAVLAAVLTAYGLYVLYDIFYISENAFVSRDLLKYRPGLTITDAEKEQESFAELRAINPDTVGWIELFGTHINYPVVQGRDDLEYLNKDIYGNSTMSGSIYLAADNSSGFNDWYNLIYGHHMDNGAMFGDIDRYLDQEYFDAHRHGILQTPDGIYDINVLACISTDSYEGTVYRMEPDAAEAYPVLRAYIEEHAAQIAEMPEELGGDTMLLGLSTCTDAVTNGRIVLFAAAEKRDPDAPVPEAVLAAEAEKQQAQKKDPPKLLAAVGHMTDSAHWALLNLVCVLLTFLTFLPLFSLRRKYRQLPYAKRTVKALTDSGKHDIRTNDIVRGLRRFIRKCRIGIAVEAGLLILSAVVFLLTENLTKQAVICDGMTGWMLLIAAAALLTDFICFRYRGERPDPPEQTDPEAA